MAVYNFGAGIVNGILDDVQHPCERRQDDFTRCGRGGPRYTRDIVDGKADYRDLAALNLGALGEGMQIGNAMFSTALLATSAPEMIEGVMKLGKAAIEGGVNFSISGQLEKRAATAAARDAEQAALRGELRAVEAPPPSAGRGSRRRPNTQRWRVASSPARSSPRNSVQSTSSASRRDELVWAMDLATGQWVLRRVAETYKTDYVGEKVRVKVADEWIELTDHHPVWVVEGVDLDARPRPEHIKQAESTGATIPGRWVDACDLRLGDVLLLKPDRRRESRPSRLSPSPPRCTISKSTACTITPSARRVPWCTTTPAAWRRRPRRIASFAESTRTSSAIGQKTLRHGKNQDVSHKLAKADGGLNTLENIEPKPHAEHVQQHMDNNDFSRWAQRKGKNS